MTKTSCVMPNLIYSYRDEIRTQCMLQPYGFLQMPQCSAIAVRIHCWPTVWCVPENHQQQPQHTSRNLDCSSFSLDILPNSYNSMDHQKSTLNRKHIWHNDKWNSRCPSFHLHGNWISEVLMQQMSQLVCQLCGETKDISIIYCWLRHIC